MLCKTRVPQTLYHVRMKLLLYPLALQTASNQERASPSQLNSHPRRITARTTA